MILSVIILIFSLLLLLLFSFTVIMSNTNIAMINIVPIILELYYYNSYD